MNRRKLYQFEVDPSILDSEVVPSGVALHAICTSWCVYNVVMRPSAETLA